MHCSDRCDTNPDVEARPFLSIHGITDPDTIIAHPDPIDQISTGITVQATIIAMRKAPNHSRDRCRAVWSAALDIALDHAVALRDDFLQYSTFVLKYSIFYISKSKWSRAL